MIDWSNGVEERNYRIPHRPDRRSVVDLLASMCAIVLIAGALIGYIYSRSQIVAIGYEVQRLTQLETSLKSARDSLNMEEEMLKSPERIDSFVRTKLGMEPISPYQRLVPKFRELGSETLALADVHPESAAPKRPSSNN